MKMSRSIRVIAAASFLVVCTALATAQGQPVVLSKYVLGASEYNRGLEQEKLSAASDTEVAGWIIGYKSEVAKQKLSLTFFKDGTIVLSMYGADSPAKKCKAVGLDVFLYDQASQQYSDTAAGSFSEDRKTFTLVQGMILDKQ